MPSSSFCICNVPHSELHLQMVLSCGYVVEVALELPFFVCVCFCIF